MARPNKDGLDYFPMDVDFFADEKIAAISGEFGIKGEITVIKLLCAVYRNGYFILWNEPLKFKLLRDLPGISPELLDQIINRLVRWGFFDEYFFNTVKVLTSRGIQKRFFAIARRRKSDAKLPYILSTEPENGVIVDNNPINVDNNSPATGLLSTITPQSKVNKRKENKNYSTAPTARAREGENSEYSKNDGITMCAQEVNRNSEYSTPEKGCAEKAPPGILHKGTFEYIPVDAIGNFLKNSTYWFETFCMNNHLEPDYVGTKIEEFARECANSGETAKDKRDCMRHFNNWLRKNRQHNESRTTASRSTNGDMLLVEFDRKTRERVARRLASDQNPALGTNGGDPTEPF